MRTHVKHRERHLVIDELACLMRKPTAKPTLEPAEVIAVVLNTTQWIPGDRLLDPDDVVVKEIVRGLKQAGYSIMPTEAERKDDDGSPHQ